MKDKLYQLTAEDMSELGGPMGTERTTVIGTWLFIDRRGKPASLQASEFARRRFRLDAGRKFGQLPLSMKLGRYYDCRTVGLELKRAKVQP